jgi:hypothetical protein
VYYSSDSRARLHARLTAAEERGREGLVQPARRGARLLGRRFLPFGRRPGASGRKPVPPAVRSSLVQQLSASVHERAAGEILSEALVPGSPLPSRRRALAPGHSVRAFSAGRAASRTRVAYEFIGQPHAGPRPGRRLRLIRRGQRSGNLREPRPQRHVSARVPRVKARRASHRLHTAAGSPAPGHAMATRARLPVPQRRC